MGPNWIDLHIGFLLLSKQGHVHNCYLERYSDLEVSLSYTQHCLCPSPSTAFVHHLALPLPITQHCICPSPSTALPGAFSADGRKIDGRNFPVPKNCQGLREKYPRWLSDATYSPGVKLMGHSFIKKHKKDLPMVSFCLFTVLIKKQYVFSSVDIKQYYLHTFTSWGQLGRELFIFCYLPPNPLFRRNCSLQIPRSILV